MGSAAPTSLYETSHSYPRQRCACSKLNVRACLLENFRLSQFHDRSLVVGFGESMQNDSNDNEKIAFQANTTCTSSHVNNIPKPLTAYDECDHCEAGVRHFNTIATLDDISMGDWVRGPMSHLRVKVQCTTRSQAFWVLQPWNTPKTPLQSL